jgi:hydrogenase-4 transcriptional activator
MRQYDGVLLRVWREASRHIEIGESAARIARLLAEHLPLEQLIVQRIDLQRGRLQTVASHTIGGRAKTLPAQVDLSPVQLKSLMSWGGQRRVARRSASKAPGVFHLIAPRGLRPEALAGPLWGTDHMEGVLILRLPRAAPVDPEHDNLVEAVLEPFGTALEIDRRLHEIEGLREKAEADRRSLLTKLGRKDMAAPIVGADAGLRHVMDRVEMISRSDVTVLLVGETGTGKEVVARAIHDRSARHAGPFVRVNCGAIPAELIDSQLFGHERGSFTGAVDTHRGWFERADGGTLFLDEIGELPLAAQVRLLRVLQDGFIERVGGQHSIHVDVRIVAATHRDIAQMTKDGRFRQDLWYRIAVFPIPIPPLRERTEDIQALACHFAEKAATRFGLTLVMPTPEDLRLLSGYSWPGNIRELAAVIDRAALLGNGRCLEVAKSLGVTAPSSAQHPVAARDSNREALDIPATGHQETPAPAGQLSLDDAMRQHIEAALRACHGRIEGPFGAAKRLNVNPHTLRSRMRKFGTDWRMFRNLE